MRRYSALACVAYILIVGCGLTPIEYTENMLDAPGVLDPSLEDPTYRVSSRPDLAALDRSMPVVICVHGYGACTFEWQEFRDYAQSDGRVLTSLVLMGAHGRAVEDMQTATWKDWQRPILEEFNAVRDLGFTRLSFATASTGGALVLEYLGRSALAASTQPVNFNLVDPIVVSSDKNLTLVNALGPILGNVKVTGTTEIEQRYWYQNRPYESLVQLNNLIELVRTQLQKGIVLPAGSIMKVYKVSDDDAADPVSALLIQKGVRATGGGSVETEMIDSHHHVPTRLAGRSSTTQADTLTQQRIFSEIVERALRTPE